MTTIQRAEPAHLLTSDKRESALHVPSSLPAYQDEQASIIRMSQCELKDLPNIPLQTVLACLHDDEYGDAVLFSHVFKGLCIYDFLKSGWYLWEGHYWIQTESKQILHLVSGFLSSVYLRAMAEINVMIGRAYHGNESDSQEEIKQKNLKEQMSELQKRARALKKIDRTHHVIEYIASLPCMNVPHDRKGEDVLSKWDCEHWLLGTSEGVIDLRTGELRPGIPTDFMRTIAPTQWRGLDEPCPYWLQTLQQIFSDRDEKTRAELISFLQRALGYGITGLYQHHIFLALIGSEGRNGKDTLASTLTNVLGQSLASDVPEELVIADDRGSSSGGASPHVMKLQGKRLAWASEPKKGSRFDAARIKKLTGQPTQTGRPLYQGYQTFPTTYLLMLLTNPRPHADADDRAFWERICPIVFNVRFVDNPDPNNPHEYKADTNLLAKLQSEASGILAWLVKGCLMWQEQGLNIPDEVLKERVDYRKGEDTLGQFLTDDCIAVSECRVTGSAFYDAYKSWAIESGLKPINRRLFSKDMEKRFRTTKPHNVTTYHGIGLRTAYLDLVEKEQDEQERIEQEQNLLAHQEHISEQVSRTNIEEDEVL